MCQAGDEVGGGLAAAFSALALARSLFGGRSCAPPFSGRPRKTERRSPEKRRPQARSAEKRRPQAGAPKSEARSA
jgi:hypothetical protein